jgi:hypothetical protein
MKTIEVSPPKSSVADRPHNGADPQGELDASEGDDLRRSRQDAIGDRRVSQLHAKALISPRAALGVAKGSGSTGTLRLAHPWN